MIHTRFPTPLRTLAGLALAGCLAALAVIPTAQADAGGEREALARLAHEIEALEPLIREAEAQAPSQARIRFRYDWLRLDLQRVAAGIEEHLAAPRAEPRAIEPLRGDYRR